MKDKKNIVFFVTVFTFLILVIIAKVSYEDMQSKEADVISLGKWYASDEKTTNSLGNIEIKFNGDETFDIYQADTQVSCMSGKYTVVYKGLLHLKSEKSGFNPPKGWNCKRSSYFKYKVKDSVLKLKYGGFEGVFDQKGEEVARKEQESKITDLHNKNFINKQAKMLLCFYAGDMYMYNLNDVENVFGDNKEVLGDVCFFATYIQESAKNKITANAENEGDVKSNPMWPQMTELGEYEFKYRVEGDFDNIVLQYEDKSYEFEKIEK
jgi:hypothetical protein